MKDAFGGIFSLFLIGFFIAMISGILAFTVNYAKAFKMKNSVISNLERFEAGPGCFYGTGSDDCEARIIEYAKSIGYSPAGGNCDSEGMNAGVGNIFCYKCFASTNSDKDWYKNHNTTGVYCTVSTKVNIDIPVFNKIMDLKIFKVHGETRVIEIPKS